MASTATVTGVVGPARAVTAQVFNNVKFFSVDTITKILELVYDNGSGEQRLQIDIGAQTTITCTVSSGSYTLTISA